MWVPFPRPLPVAKIGTDDISFYGTYIPVTNVFFFYSTITIDDAKRRDLPLPATSAWSADRNYLYGGWGWEYMDNGEEFSRATSERQLLARRHAPLLGPPLGDRRFVPPLRA